jgi:uncharacterized circularly permuted ATP-grasp superfamily protein
MPRTFYDEMHGSDGAVRPHYQAVADWLAATPPARIAQKREEADRAFHRSASRSRSPARKAAPSA